MKEIIYREAVYLWYYFDLQFRQIFWYWVLGMIIGSAISVFAKNYIHKAAEFLGKRIPGIVGLVFASLLGIASPLCMYGTIPICAAFSRKGIKDDFLAAFMMSSILLNPQLIIYSAALGGTMLAVRIASCFLMGIAAGFLVHIFYCRKNKGNAEQNNAVVSRASTSNQSSSVVVQNEFVVSRASTTNQSSSTTRQSSSTSNQSSSTSNQSSSAVEQRRPEGRVSNHQNEFNAEPLDTAKKSYFDFSSFDEPKNRDTDPNIFLRFIKNLWRNIKATGPMFLLGIALSAIFQRYVPADAMARLFGKQNEAFGLLMAATIGVPLYVCGGGTIPLLQQWLAEGMSRGSAAAFMLTGPSTKITNLGALKIALGIKNFALYIAFVILFSLLTGFVVNLFF